MFGITIELNDKSIFIFTKNFKMALFILHKNMCIDIANIL